MSGLQTSETTTQLNTGSRLSSPLSKSGLHQAADEENTHGSTRNPPCGLGTGCRMVLVERCWSGGAWLEEPALLRCCRAARSRVVLWTPAPEPPALGRSFHLGKVKEEIQTPLFSGFCYGGYKEEL